MLKNGPALSNIELDKWCYKHIHGYRGTINKNEFPKIYQTMKPGESVILNLDPDYRRGGTHWVGLRVAKNSPVVFYKDSFGAPPPAVVVDTVSIKNDNGLCRGLLFGDIQTQKLDQSNCGWRAAMFLKDMVNGSNKGAELDMFRQIA